MERSAESSNYVTPKRPRPQTENFTPSNSQKYTANTTSNSSRFYVLLTPKNFESTGSPDERIFTDFNQASKSLKSVKGSRIKVCTDIEDALNWSSQFLDDPNESHTDDSEKSTIGGFTSLSAPDLAGFRKIIEKGDLQAALSTVTTNPRFLISAGDTPVVLMEGPRYNAVHIASKSNQHEVLRFILKTIDDPSFIRKMYPRDNDIVNEERRKFLLDLYLNTPDKAGLDTPLHFACKFGSVECVEILLSYSACDRHRKNKIGKEPREVICSRKVDQKAMKKIEKIFDARYYIAIARDDDNVSILKPTETPPVKANLSGLAGPMSAETADELYISLKSPAKSPSPLTRIRLSDGTRGVERITRMECHKKRLNWVEYWKFLDLYVDLSSSEGLSKLEEHLKSVHENLLENEKSSSQTVPYNEKSTVSLLCDCFADLALSPEHKSLTDPLNDCQDEKENFFTPPESPFFDVDFFINGVKLTQEDKDAANALSQISIDRSSHPHVYHWYNTVTQKMFFMTKSSSFTDGDFPIDLFSTPSKSYPLRASIHRRRLSLDQLSDVLNKSESDSSCSDDDDLFEDSISEFHPRVSTPFL